MKAPHLPVMLDEVVAGLALRAGGIYVDATFGRGGYSRALLEAAPDVRVFGLDRDPDAVEAGQQLARESDRFTMVQGAFSQLDQHMASAMTGAPANVVAGAKVDGVQGIAFDLGVSSPQLDTPARGFSFRQDGPLDMRMDNTSGLSAADIVNTWDEQALADIIRTYGEERYARRVAAALVRQRAVSPLFRTAELAAVVRSVVRPGKEGHDPATRTFQALRIVVNDELGELEQGLNAAARLLAPGGRLAVVSFHSLEDRIVKQFLKQHSGRTARPSRYLPAVDSGSAERALFLLVGAQPQGPGAPECQHNPRARSARLRVAERTAVPFPSSLLSTTRSIPS